MMPLRLIRYSYASTRSRALAAGLLKPERIEELLACGSKAEAGRWLEKNVDLPGDGIERGLHERFMVFGRKVARSLPAPARRLVEAYLFRAEIESLKVLCRMLLTGRRPEVRPYLLPGASGKLITDDVAASRNLEELAERLPCGPYRYSVRTALRLKSDPEERLFRVESGLDAAFWESVGEQLRRLPLFDRLAARETLDMRADIDRFRVVGRGLRAGLEAATIVGALPPLGSLLPPWRVRIALGSEKPATAVERLAAPAGGDPLAPDVEPFLFRRLFRHLRRELISPPFDISVPLAAVLLMELETRDLKAVFGGKRLDREREEISSFLVVCRGA